MCSSRVRVGWIRHEGGGCDRSFYCLRVLHVLYIPTRYPDSLPEGAPTDHFGRLQSSDAISHARTLVEAIRLALASP